MSIVIPGMKMPKDGECIVVQSDGTAYKYDTGDVVLYGDAYNETAVVIELPPHGRLGDLDALLADHGLGTYCPECKRDERSCQYEMIHTTMDFCGWIEDAPTIVPADGGANDG